MLHYLQSWGQSTEQQVEALNVGVRQAGIKARFVQDKERSGWECDDENEAARAKSFRGELSHVWCGEANQEIQNIVALIRKYRERK